MGKGSREYWEGYRAARSDMYLVFIEHYGKLISEHVDKPQVWNTGYSDGVQQLIKEFNIMLKKSGGN